MLLDLNFASREYLLLRKLYTALGIGLAAAVAGMLILFVVHNSDVSRLERMRGDVRAQELRLGEAKKKLAGYEREMDQKTVAATYTEVEFANAVIRNRTFSWTQFMNRLETLVPDGVGITGITPDFGSLNVDIAGTAKDMNAVTGFIGRLTGSEYFEDVPPVFSTSEEKLPSEIGKTVQRFNIKIRYIPDPGKPEKALSEGKEG